MQKHMQFYFAKALAIDKNLPQNFTPKEIECAIVATATMKRTRFLPVTWPFQGRRGRSPNAAPEGKPGDGNIRARFRSF
jgi:hypothetical protein